MSAAFRKKSTVEQGVNPNYVIKKNPSHGARHGPTERQRMYHEAHNTLRIANKKGYKTMLARFLNSPRYRDSLTNIVWDENTCIAYDEIAKEDHSYVATRGERSRNEKSLHQRDDYQEAKKTCNKLYKEYAATAECGDTRIIHPQEHVRQRPNQ